MRVATEWDVGLSLTDIDAAWLAPVVDNSTPPTIPNSPTISISVNHSIPQRTANAADVIGSAAFTVSTYVGAAAPNAMLVVKNPSEKYTPVNISLEIGGDDDDDDDDER